MSAETTESKGGSVLDIALAYLRAGLSIVPIKRDGSKSAALKSWKEYQWHLVEEDEVRGWYGKPRPPGIAIIGGKVSGGLERLDFDLDAERIFPAWQALVETEAPGLLARLSLVRTPRGFGAHHVYYRCTEVEIPGNTKLAEDPARPAKERCLIETRGEGGYTIAPGSPPECHETGRTWEHVGGPLLTDLVTISAAERDILIRCARSFDRKVQEPPGAKEWKGNAGSGLLPGDDFNGRGPAWPEMLEPHGWTAARATGDVTYWRRPGKDGPGWSATTGVCKSEKSGELFAVFSSNASPFEGPANGRPCSCYSKFAVFALLNHGGDFKAAAKELGRQGYGEQGQRRTTSNGRAPERDGEGVRLGPLVLRLGPPHETPSKLIVPLTVFRGNTQVDMIHLASSLNARRQAADHLARHFGDDDPGEDETQGVFCLILAEARQRLDRNDGPSGPLLRELVRNEVMQRLRFSGRNEDGTLLSGALGRNFSRSDFVTYHPDPLLTAVARATDAPAGRPALLDAVVMELRVLWPELMALPLVGAAALAAEDTAALRTRFHAALLKIWKAASANRREGTSDGTPPVVHGESLATLAQKCRRACIAAFEGAKGRVAWAQLHSPLEAWIRPAVLPGGEIGVRLAMRFELGGQLRPPVHLPGVYDQASLTAMGRACGDLDPNPSVPTRLGNGASPADLAVLSVPLTEELLDNPADWPASCAEDAENDGSAPESQ